MIDLDLLVRASLWTDSTGGADPVILVEDATRVRITSAAGEPMGLFVSSLLEAGMDLVFDPAGLDLPVLSDWSVTVTDAGVAIGWPAGTPLVDDPVPLSRQWRRAALAAGRVALLGGTDLGLADTNGMARPVWAARNGSLVGGVAPVTALG
jgi:hypothetical protein